MHRKTAVLGSAILLIAVLLGAFGAHGLKRIVTSSDLTVWHTGVSYQFYHGFAILFMSLAFDHLNYRKHKLICKLFTWGIGLFSGSLYLLVLSEPIGIQNIKSFVGPLTPIGGTLFIAAWGMLLFTSLSKAKG